MSDKVERLSLFLMELDALKGVQRRSYTEGGSRLENSAEHSWHLAMACWNVAEAFDLDLNHERLLKLALVHDMGEIDAGDTFLYSASREDAHREERAGVLRLSDHPGNAIGDLVELWDQQEYGSTPEAKLLKAMDRLLPFLLNIHSHGKTWADSGVRKSQVESAHAFIADNFPELHAWMAERISHAVQEGWLKG